MRYNNLQPTTFIELYYAKTNFLLNWHRMLGLTQFSKSCDNAGSLWNICDDEITTVMVLSFDTCGIATFVLLGDIWSSCNTSGNCGICVLYY